MNEHVVQQINLDEVIKYKSRLMLDNIYDEMILWNMRKTDIPLRTFLGMSPADYVSFMGNPEAWAIDYLNRKIER